jgi:hypothetical protein
MSDTKGDVMHASRYKVARRFTASVTLHAMISRMSSRNNAGHQQR